MKRTVCMLMLALILVLPLSVLAQDQPKTTTSTTSAAVGEERDRLELGFFGGLSIPTGGLKNFSDTLGAKTGFNGGVNFGVFLSPKISLGGSFGYHQFGIDNAVATQHHRIFSPNVYLKYQFTGESDLIPYVRIHAGADFDKLSTYVLESNGTPKYREIGYGPAFAAGIGGGFFMYTSDYSGFFLEATYHEAFAKNASKDYKGHTYKVGDSYGLFELSLGIHLLFGSGE